MCKGRAELAQENRRRQQPAGRREADCSRPIDDKAAPVQASSQSPCERRDRGRARALKGEASRHTNRTRHRLAAEKSGAQLQSERCRLHRKSVEQPGAGTPARLPCRRWRQSPTHPVHALARSWQ